MMLMRNIRFHDINNQKRKGKVTRVNECSAIGRGDGDEFDNE